MPVILIITYKGYVITSRGSLADKGSRAKAPNAAKAQRQRTLAPLVYQARAGSNPEDRSALRTYRSSGQRFRGTAGLSLFCFKLGPPWVRLHVGSSRGTLLDVIGTCFDVFSWAFSRVSVVLDAGPWGESWEPLKAKASMLFLLACVSWLLPFLFSNGTGVQCGGTGA